MTSLLKIAAMQPQLSPTEQKIAGYALAQPELLVQQSSSELAASIGVSQSSIVKFSQKLGFKGYADLRLSLSGAIGRQRDKERDVIHGDIELGDSHHVVMNKLLQSKAGAMQKTLDANNDDNLDLALDLVQRATRIQIAGVGASSLVAKDLGFKLMKLGRAVLVESDSHIQLANASTLTSDDLLIALSYSGASADIVNIARVAKSCGAATLAITGMMDNPLSKEADVVLHTVADEDQARSSSISARDAQFMVTDLLFILLTQVQPDAAEHIANSYKAVEAMKIR
ncbi:MurR/RpiR family transcriptional regulator [Zobellella aerophila]|uniref:MurR/RpiR family transcriptional regulator n=1 Tax=Zobellella aerophila TaxID=870480 RepID=A0ABP6WIE4_9GAMM